MGSAARDCGAFFIDAGAAAHRETVVLRRPAFHVLFLLQVAFATLWKNRISAGM
jgi:hypothetical protein